MPGRVSGSPWHPLAMTRGGFVSNGAHGPDVHPPSPLRAPERGYMTAAGVERHRLRLQELVRRRDAILEADTGQLHARSELATVEREIAQVSGVLQAAIVIQLDGAPRDEVRFGAEVELEDEHGERTRFQLVGEHEAAPERRLVNWYSPLGRALAGARLGDRVEWRRPAGLGAYVVRGISYP